MALEKLVITNECIICGCNLDFNPDLELGEILDCTDCGSELEVTSINPIELTEAPTEGEDWGE
ncbi:MAG: Alpha-aminoadipate carrier protein LysW [Candidatus Heimdallarchaeota archaeon LC_3]|nr:MAG: Alpha-aminoadipate carrier protein LysW [Candidatus Heimdallarchaeota archaeon LC_3]